MGGMGQFFAPPRDTDQPGIPRTRGDAGRSARLSSLVRIRKLALIPATILDKIVNMCQYQIKENAVIFRDRRTFR
jgi:hypothetical protein